MSLFDELKRRNVFRVAIAYGVAAWFILQLADVVLENIAAPGWVMQTVMLVLVAGFPLAVIFAWAFEMTPEGIKKEKDVDRNQSIAAHTGKKLNNTILVLMALAIAYLLFDRFSGPPQPGSEPFSQESSVQFSDYGDEKSDLTLGGASADSSIAVLPFANRSDEKEDLFFTDGIHDDLLTQLAKIDELKVISRTSVMKYRGTEKTIPEIATELGVTTILEGGVQRAGKRIRINAQLIDVVTDEHLWAETFDREMTMENIFDIQTEITRQIVTAVKGELSETEQQSLAAAPTDNLEAYEAFLHARASTNRGDYTKEKYVEARPWAERAVKLDPEFAEAWAILSEIHGQAVWQAYDSTPERHKAAREALSKATQLNPNSAFVKAAQADYFYRFDNDYEAALKMYKEALEIAPGDGRILFNKALTQRRLGLWHESINTFKKAIQLDPANIFIATQMIDTLTWMNEWDRVESLLNEWVIEYPESRDLRGQKVRAKLLHHGDLVSARVLFDLLPPTPGYLYKETASALLGFERNFDALLVIQDSLAFTQYVQFGTDAGLAKGIIYQKMGDEESSRQYLQQQLNYSLTRTPNGTLVDTFELMNLALCWSYLGEHKKSLAASSKAIEMTPQEKDHLSGTVLGHIHTLILARSGYRDQALERLAENIDGIEGLTRWQLYLDPAWDFFRDDERFNELARPLNLKETSQ